MEQLNNLQQRVLKHSLVRYIIIGGTTVAIDLCLFFVFREVFHFYYPIAVTISYWTSIVFNFTANRFWTFSASETDITKNSIKYGLLLGFNYLFTLGFMVVFVSGLHANPDLSRIAAVAVQTLWTYVAYKKVVFK